MINRTIEEKRTLVQVTMVHAIFDCFLRLFIMPSNHVSETLLTFVSRFHSWFKSSKLTCILYRKHRTRFLWVWIPDQETPPALLQFSTTWCSYPDTHSPRCSLFLYFWNLVLLPSLRALIMLPISSIYQLISLFLNIVFKTPIWRSIL